LLCFDLKSPEGSCVIGLLPANGLWGNDWILRALISLVG
jgi:hypothetical protein